MPILSRRRDPVKGRGGARSTSKYRGEVMSKRGGYLGGSTIITVVRDEKDMARRKAHWARKLGHDQIEQMRGVADDEGPRLIKRSETAKKAGPSMPKPTQSNGVMSRSKRRAMKRRTPRMEPEL
jgi:hypothetical protein